MRSARQVEGEAQQVGDGADTPEPACRIVRARGWRQQLDGVADLEEHVPVAASPTHLNPAIGGAAHAEGQAGGGGGGHQRAPFSFASAAIKRASSR